MLLDIFQYNSPPSGSSISGSEQRYTSLENSGIGDNSSKIFGYYKITEPTQNASNPDVVFQFDNAGTPSGTNYDKLTLATIPLAQLGFSANSLKVFLIGKLYNSITVQGINPRSIIEIFSFKLFSDPENLGKLIFERKRNTLYQGSYVAAYNGTYSFKIGSTDYLFPSSAFLTTTNISFTNDSTLQIRHIANDESDTTDIIKFTDTTGGFDGKAIYKGIIQLT